MASVDEAIRAVRSLASELGLDAEPEIVADRSNLVLGLGPDAVARVAMATSLARVGMAWLRREVDLARFLAARGGSVTRPAARIDPGPFERAGLVISFWQRETLVEHSPDPAAAGATLAALHRELASYPREKLPWWGGHEEARAVLARARTSGVLVPDEIVRLERGFAQADRIVASAEARTASMQGVHGDAHIGNVMATARGVLWTDWEDAFLGPIEWDLACLRSRAVLFGEERDAIDAMTRAYDAPYDAELVQDLGLVRNVQVIAWLAVFAERQPELADRMRRRLAKLP